MWCTRGPDLGPGSVPNWPDPPITFVGNTDSVVAVQYSAVQYSSSSSALQCSSMHCSKVQSSSDHYNALQCRIVVKKSTVKLSAVVFVFPWQL